MNVKQIILEIAIREHKPPEEIEAAMLSAMREAMASKDPKVQKMWKKLSPHGKEPTLEEFIKYCANKLKN